MTYTATDNTVKSTKNYSNPTQSLPEEEEIVMYFATDNATDNTVKSTKSGLATKLLWPILVIGLALVVVPLAMSFPSKASAGQSMVSIARPIMQPAAVATTVKYYNTFAALRPIATAGVQAAAEVPGLMATFSAQMHMTPAQMQKFLAANYPAVATMAASLPQAGPVFSQVPVGLDRFAPLMTDMQAQDSNFWAIANLPDYRVLAWTIIGIGALLALLAGGGLGAPYALQLTGRRRQRFGVVAVATADAPV